MRTNRTLQILIAGVALVAATLAGIVTAGPAMADEPDCWGDCGEAGFAIARVSPETPRYGEAALFIIKLKDTSDSCSFVGGSQCDAPHGAVEWYDGDATAPFASAPLEPSVADDSYAEIEYAGLSGGAHTIKVVYVPGSHDATSATFDVTVQPQATETVVIEAVNRTSAVGQPDSVTAGVRFFQEIDESLGAQWPTGMVEFFDGTVSLGPAPLGHGTAALAVTFTEAGNRTLLARYLGDGNYDSSLSPPMTYMVTKGDTDTVLAGPPSATVYGQPAPFTANASAQSPAVGTPTGIMTFTADGNVFSTSPVDAAGSLSTSPFDLPVGQHAVQASYAGDANFNGSSATVTHTVNKASTSVVLNSPTPDPWTLGQAVGLQATVLVSAPGAGVPTGTVQFRDGTTPLGAPVPLSNQVANLTTTALGGGNHVITAVYAGDGNFNGSTSNGLSRTVICNTTITGGAGNVTVPASGTTCISGATITGGVNIPAGAKVSIVNSSIAGYLTANGGAGTLLVCGSTIGGITVAGAVGTVSIGDPTNGCSANHLRGSLQVSSSTGGVVIGGNAIAGWLQCSGNSPAPTNGGRPNTAAGRTGQCATPANF